MPNQFLHPITKSSFVPHQYLSNMAMTHYQNTSAFVSGKMFPKIPVALQTAYYYKFNKGDLTRDNVRPKPELGTVAPAIFGHSEEQYKCEVDQVITGISQITALNYRRSNTPSSIDPRTVKTKFIAEQILLHQDIQWAKKFFNKESWANVYTGISTGTPTSSQFWQFDNENADPVQIITDLTTEMMLSGLRKPNKMCLGAKVFAALKKSSAILDRVKFQGSEKNPANVTTNVLAQLFGLDEVLVSEGVYNAAEVGAKDDMRFICKETDLLLVYATPAPSMEEPSAGYTFVWDMLGNGITTPVLQYEGAPGTHTEYVEGLIAVDQRITCADLGIYLSEAVSSTT